MSSLEFRVDPSTKSLVKVTEAATTADELRVELQAAADAAQNRLNAANEGKVIADAALVAATGAVDAAEAEVTAANEDVTFSTDRLGQLDEAVTALAALDGATPEGENAAEDTAASEGVDVSDRISTADQAPA